MILRDAQLNTVGYIEETSGGKLVAKDKDRRVKGYYDPRSNRTTDEQMRTVGHGNLLASLLQRDAD
jgi:hypothetical protein